MVIIAGFFIIICNNSVFAAQKCNPDVNTVISGVPYCKDVKVERVETIQPDEINNAFDPNKYKNPQNYPIIIDATPYMPRGSAGNTNIPHNTYRSTPNIPPVNQAVPYQTVPNAPMDVLPIEIPGTPGIIQQAY